MADEDLVFRVATLLKNLENLHNNEFRVQYNLHENSFFQKLIPWDLLEDGPRIKPDHYFKGLLFLTYFTNIIEGDYKISENLVALSKALRREEKAEGKDNGASYLNINTVVVEAGVIAQEKPANYYADSFDTITKRYGGPVIDFSSDELRKPDPYCMALGQRVYDMLTAENLPYLQGVSSRNDLGALIFADCVMDVLEKTDKGKIRNELSSGNYLAASLIALQDLREQTNKQLLLSTLQRGKND